MIKNYLLTKEQAKKRLKIYAKAIKKGIRLYAIIKRTNIDGFYFIQRGKDIDFANNAFCCTQDAMIRFSNKTYRL